MSRRVAHDDLGTTPFWVAWVPARRDLPVPDDAKGKLALAHATRQFQPSHSGPHTKAHDR